jgi:hypothetical protein
MPKLKPETDEDYLTVGKLKELLAQHPDTMPIIYSCCSQWTRMQAHEVSPLEGIDCGGYVSLPYRGVQDNPLRKTFLAFPGN